MTGLTGKQERVLLIIEHSIARRGYPPTRREIADELKLSSTNGVADHMEALVRKGYLAVDNGKARGMRPMRPGRAL